MCTFNKNRGCKNLSATSLKMGSFEYIDGDLCNYGPALIEKTS